MDADRIVDALALPADDQVTSHLPAIGEGRRKDDRRVRIRREQKRIAGRAPDNCGRCRAERSRPGEREHREPRTPQSATRRVDNDVDVVRRSCRARTGTFWCPRLEGEDLDPAGTSRYGDAAKTIAEADGCRP